MVRVACVVSLLCGVGFAAGEMGWPRRESLDQFEVYIRGTESRIEREVHTPTFLWASQSRDRERRVRSGGVVVEPWIARGDSEIDDALIHDWIGAIFIPGATIDQAVSFLQAYDNHKTFYSPEVVESRLLSHDGDEWRVYYRLVKKKIITVTFNTEHAVTYTRLSPTRLHSTSRATRIGEVKNAGTPAERELPAGQDHGFLWRLNTYWRLEEKDGGVFMECQTISLTRSVMTGLGWLINPIIRSFPRESLGRLLSATRIGVLTESVRHH
jgi:hypothetical protein